MTNINKSDEKYSCHVFKLNCRLITRGSNLYSDIGESDRQKNRFSGIEPVFNISSESDNNQQLSDRNMKDIQEQISRKLTSKESVRNLKKEIVSLDERDIIESPISGTPRTQPIEVGKFLYMRNKDGSNANIYDIDFEKLSNKIA
jgi:hypothetical protein